MPKIVSELDHKWSNYIHYDHYFSDLGIPQIIPLDHNWPLYKIMVKFTYGYGLVHFVYRSE